MAIRDYQKEASDYEDEIRSLYPKGDEPDLTPDDNNDLSLDANESNQDAMTGADESVPQEPEETNVPESKYKAAVVEMNKKQQEAAELRKRVAELEQQLATQSTAQSTDTEELGEEEMPDDVEEENPEMTADKQDFKSLIAELDDMGLGDFVPVLQLLNDKIEKCMAHTGKLGEVADDYIGYRKQLHTDAFWNAIREAHPDIQSFIPPSDAEYEDYTPEQKEYADWYAEQDEETKALFSSQDPAMVIKGLDMFRGGVSSDEGMIDMEKDEEEAAPSVAVMVASKPQTPSKLEQAKAVDSPNMKTENNGKPVKNRKFTREEVARMSQKEYDDNEEAILEAMKRGEI